MRTHRSYSYWHMLIAVLGLLVILTACGGGSTNSTTGTSTPSTTNTPSPSTNPTTVPASIVSFTASGGLTGPYTLSDKDASSGVGSSPNGKALNVFVSDQDWSFVLGYVPYTGPGTYTVSHKAGSAISAGVSLTNTGNTKSWSLLPPSSCHLTIASDTSLNVGGTTYHEIKGSFSCSSLATIASTSAPLTLNNGQLDVMATEQ